MSWKDGSSPAKSTRCIVASSHGLTVDEALARIMEVDRLLGDVAERRKEYRKILTDVRRLGYHDGGEDERCSGSWS